MDSQRKGTSPLFYTPFDPSSSARAQQQRSLWRGLVVAPEQRCSAYNADDYRYPQSVEDQIVTELGGVYGPYTGRWFASQFETDIEHMVARSEAHDSGLCTADEGLGVGYPGFGSGRESRA